MFLLLIKQFWPASMEESIILRLVLRLALLVVKYFVNTMVFLLASKKFHEYYHSEEMWRWCLDGVNRVCSTHLSIPYLLASTTTTTKTSDSIIETALSSNNSSSRNTSICRHHNNSSMDEYEEFKTPAICSTSTSSIDTETDAINVNNTAEATTSDDKLISDFDEPSILHHHHLQINRHSKFAVKRFRTYYRNSLFKVNLNETRASNESRDHHQSELHHNGLPDLLNQKTKNDTNSMLSNGMPPVNKIPAEKSLDEVRFNEVEVPESLAKQLEFYDRDELLRLIAYQKKYLDYKESRIRDLENYIDNLVVKIIETEPSILMNASNILSKNIRI